MVAYKVNTKVGMLLKPDELSQGFAVIESFQIFKSSSGIRLETVDLENSCLRKLYPFLPEEARNVFYSFCSEAIDQSEQQLRQLFQNKKVGIPHEVYQKNAMYRKLQQSFEVMKPFAKLVKWYHKVPAGENKTYKTSPCVFNTYKPQLQFQVVKVSGRLQLETNIVLNGATYNAKDFKRYQFLLESGNEYFVLSYKDYQTLDWLQRNTGEQYSGNANLFAEKILSRLEADYPVNRNNHFTTKEIVALPVNRVLLSELNNSFLMLTPQWIYDGFLVEGPWKEVYETVVNGEATSVRRNKEAESAFLELLVSMHPNFANQKNGYYYVSFLEAQKKQWFLKAYHKLLDLGIELVGMDMLNYFRYSPHKVETTTTTKKEEDGHILLQMTVSFGSEQLKLAELQKMLLAGQKAVLLKDGSLGILHDQWLHQYAEIIKHGKVNNDEIEVSKFLAITQQQTPEDQQVLRKFIKEQWWQKWQQWQNTSQPVYELPSIIKATLRPYQQKGFEWMTLLSEAGAGACLADDMGLGKTLQTICFLAYYIQRHPTSVNIIVCPSSLIYNWQQELQKFAPGITSVVYHGSARNTIDVTDNTNRVIITSYGTLRADAGALTSNHYGAAVIDESHNIKNPASQIANVVSLLTADTRIALSGTPVVNNTFDLYSQLNFALPQMYGSKEFFKREYADAIDRNHDQDKIKALQKLTAPFILRRTKEQVAVDLPGKTEMILWCNMNREQKDLYNEIKDQVKSNLFLNIKNDGLNKSKLAVLQGMLKLRQICNSPLLLPPEEQQLCKQSVKTDVLMGELSNILKEHKALVFSQFSSMLNLLAQECDRQGIKYYHFDGQTPPAKRMEMVKAYQNKENTTNLFLISLKAGNTGLTLTAADYVFLFDPWWNTAVEQQAIDRTHRIGQTKNVFAYKIICKDTIEEKIIQLQQRKKQLAEELISEDDGFIKSLNEEDIEYLFS